MPDPKPSSGAPSGPERSFEQALAELESCVRRIDGGELPLEQALAAFETGVSLVQECHEKLDNAEQRLMELSAGPDGLQVKPAGD